MDALLALPLLAPPADLLPSLDLRDRHKLRRAQVRQAMEVHLASLSKQTRLTPAVDDAHAVIMLCAAVTATSCLADDLEDVDMYFENLSISVDSCGDEAGVERDYDNMLLAILNHVARFGDWPDFDEALPALGSALVQGATLFIERDPEVHRVYLRELCGNLSNHLRHHDVAKAVSTVAALAGAISTVLTNGSVPLDLRFDPSVESEDTEAQATITKVEDPPAGVIDGPPEGEEIMVLAEEFPISRLDKRRLVLLAQPHPPQAELAWVEHSLTFFNETLAHSRSLRMGSGNTLPSN